MKKKLFGIFLAIVTLALLSTVALAEEKDWALFPDNQIGFNNGGNFVNITLPTTDNCYTYGTNTAVTASNEATLPGSGWTWALQKHATDANGVEYTLTLKNFDITANAQHALMFKCDLNLVLQGANNIKANGADRSGIFGNSNLYISGTGSLTAEGLGKGIFAAGSGSITISGGTVTATANATTTTTSYGIRTENGNLTISGGNVTATATATATTNATSYGIYSYRGSIAISGGTVNATANCTGTTNATSNGIYTESGTIDISGGDVTATATGEYATSNGIYTQTGTIDISGGEVTARGSTYGIFTRNGNINISVGTVNATATGNGENSQSYGISAGGSITIKSGTVTATGNGEISQSFGISASGSITIEGGTVNANATATGTADAASYGIYTPTGSITIEGGTVNANATGTADAASYGIYTPTGSITIEGGTVNATATGTGTSYGISTNAALGGSGGSDGSNINISGGNVTAGGSICGIFVNNGSITISGRTVTATASKGTGISAGGSITISGSTVTAEGSFTATVAANSSGIHAQRNISISGCTVNATATSDGKYATSYGIYADDSMTISGGTVTATANATATEATTAAGYETGCAYGIFDLNGTITISDDAAVTCNATGTAAGDSTHGYGIYAKTGSINISGKNIIAQGSKQAFSKTPVLSYSGGYKWRTASSGDLTLSSDTAYAFADTHTYVQIASDITPAASGSASAGSASSFNEIRGTFYGGEDEDSIKVKLLSGSGTVTMTPLDKNSEDYTLLVRGQSGEPVLAYEITPSSNGEGIVMFNVGRGNAGKEYTVLHKLPDGSIEAFHVVCADNGYISVKVKSFSPFAVFAGNVSGGTAAAASAGYIANPDTGANDAAGIVCALGAMALIALAAVGKKHN